MAKWKSGHRGNTKWRNQVPPNILEDYDRRLLLLFLPVRHGTDHNPRGFIQIAPPDELHDASINTVGGVANILEDHDATRKIRSIDSTGGAADERDAAARQPPLSSAPDQRSRTGT